MSNTVLLEVKNSIAIITLNRTEKFNAFNREMALCFQDVLRQIEADKSIRCVYLTANGKAFCAGQDLGEVTQENPLSITDIVEQHYNPIILGLRNMELPVICAVNGIAAGAGASIALAADITVAKESASFVQAFSKIGLIPDSGATYTLPRFVGIQKAMGLMMFADKVSAKEAVEIGMIYKYFADDVFEIESFKLAETLAAMPTKGLIYTKQLLNQSLQNNLEQQLKLEAVMQEKAGNTNDFKEGVEAFLEKRVPVFKGN